MTPAEKQDYIISQVALGRTLEEIGKDYIICGKRGKISKQRVSQLLHYSIASISIHTIDGVKGRYREINNMDVFVPICSYKATQEEKDLHKKWLIDNKVCTHCKATGAEGKWTTCAVCKKKLNKYEKQKDKFNDNQNEE